MLTVLILSACVSNQPPIPDWGEARQEFGAATYATPLPPLCELPWTATGCWALVEQYEEVAAANTRIANLNANALEKTEEAYDEAISGGEKQQWVSEQYRQLLQEEKTEHFWDNITHRLLIAVGILGALL